MDGRLDKKTKAARAAELAERQLSIERKDAKQAEGTVVPVLFETAENGAAYGHTGDFRYVCVKTDLPLHGEVKNVTLCGYENGTYSAVLTDGGK